MSLTPVAEGLTAPLGFESPPGIDRHYVVDQAGTVEVLAPDGGVVGRFLDVRDRMVEVGGYDERGLLGLAFHPDFPEDDRVFVRYSAPNRPGTPEAFDHTFVLAEFRATPDAADPERERTLLEIPQPQMNHNAGSVLFGPDGYCYVGVGDGGAGGDRGRGHVEDWYDAVDGGNGQDVTENLLGSVLRIDVDSGDGDRPYGIPEDNPLVGEPGLDEQFAWGFRNPWRLSFGPDGRLFAADVGQNAYEEVDVVENGGNYGWNVREGTHCYSARDCPGTTPDGEPLIDPVIEYPHGGDGPSGLAVIGGHVYGGSVAPLRGRYVFGDWNSGGSGALFVADEREEGRWPVEYLGIDGRQDDRIGRFLLGLGTDPDGELYACTSGRTGVGGSTGVVYRVDPADGGGGTTGTGSGTTDTRTTTGAGTTAGGDPTTGSTPSGSGTAGDGTTAGDGSSNGTATGSTTDGGGQGLPGFGAVGALAGLGGLAAWRRLRRGGREGEE